MKRILIFYLFLIFSSVFNCSHVALCFFGLTRSLYYTKKSLTTHIFDIIKSLGYTSDVYLHTYNQTSISNPRSKEFNITLNFEEWKELSSYRLYFYFREFIFFIVV